MSYERIKDLRPALFKRYCGVKPETFQKMVALVSDHLSNRRVKTGRPPKLSVEDQVLMTLEYWRESRTCFHLARSWGIRESSVWRATRRVGETLTKSKAFTLPGKKKLQPADREIEFIVVDVAGTPVERPRKSKKPIPAASRSGTRRKARWSSIGAPDKSSARLTAAARLVTLLFTNAANWSRTRALNFWLTAAIKAPRTA
jgi:hypothetical protein